MDPIVQAVVEGAQHTEYELRAVKKVLPAQYAGKSRILLTGVLDLVIQQQRPLTYHRVWQWDSMIDLTGRAIPAKFGAIAGDLEIWDYKGTRAGTDYIADYVRQLLTYAALFRDRTGALPVRCVLFFINEKRPQQRLLAINGTKRWAPGPDAQDVNAAAERGRGSHGRRTRAAEQSFGPAPYLRVNPTVHLLYFPVRL